jgi:glc operon protein GlcG
MSFHSVLRYVAICALTFSAGNASAQQLAANYGSPIGGEAAKKIASAALAEARKNNWKMAVSIVDPSGELVYFEKIDGTQAASNEIAIDKARSSVRFKRPTKAFQDALAKGGVEMRYLSLRGVVAAEGGVPIVMGGVIVGAIGVSGGTGAQDEQCAEAGVAGVGTH